MRLPRRGFSAYSHTCGHFWQAILDSQCDFCNPLRSQRPCAPLLAIWAYLPHDGDDKCVWLPICSLMECTILPPEVLTCNKESLMLMSQYFGRTQAHMKPYTKLSVLGIQYMLWSILGDRELGQTVLNGSVVHFCMVLHNKPHMAHLLLIVFLDTLLILFHPLPFRFKTSILQRWKKSNYTGSVGFLWPFSSPSHIVFMSNLSSRASMSVPKHN